MNIVFTGTLTHTRDDNTDRYEKFGIDVKNSVTKKTDVLIKGWDPGASKIAKAEKYGIRIMDEAAFFDMLKVENPEFFL